VRADLIIVSGLSSVNAVQPEPALRQHKATDGLVHPKGWQLEAEEASGPGLSIVDEILILYSTENAGSPM
jgi:hypothetical protein